MAKNSFEYEYVFPAIRGIQAGREYFASMCPLRLIPKIFIFNEDELLPEMRAQRLLNKARIPEMAKYLVDNKDSYVFSAITASIDADVKFIPASEEGDAANVGSLSVPMSAQFVINDGQHRRAAIEQALREEPELGAETIAVVFFIDRNLKRSQQMFSDLNRHAVRPSRSIGVLYDHRDDVAEVSRKVVANLPLFRELVEMEKSTLSARSKRLFTFSALYSANSALLADLDYELDDAITLATEFWATLIKVIPEWELVRVGRLTAGEVREDFIHSHGVVLQALGRAGNALIKKNPKSWEKKLRAVKKINWARANTDVWEGRTMHAGRLSKATRSVILTSNVVKNELGLALSADEQKLEVEVVEGSDE